MGFLKRNYLFLIVIIVAFILRFTYLGYSDYQGDEIKALFLPSPGQSLTSYLLDQRKGPVQFLVTAALGLINPSYDNQLLIRLPFGIAGFLAVVYLYKLVEKHFGKHTAFFAALFFATNGFFIAFSRLVQYQSFVILFMILALYFFTLALREEKWRVWGIYLGFVSWALSILSHYDGVLIAPFAFYLVVSWFVKNRSLFKHLFFSLVISGSMLTAFYIPFVLTLSDSTISYWQGRIEGTGGKISSSIYLFKVYHPIYTIHFYYFFGAVGFVTAAVYFIKNLLNKHKSLLEKLINSKSALIVWFLLPFVFMEYFVDIPGTHIYAYLTPLVIIMGIGVGLLFQNVADLVQRISGLSKLFYKVFAGLGFFVLYLFLFLQSYAIYIDHHTEYPWEDEKFFVWTFAKPSAVYHLSLFGFPYYRHWEGIAQTIKEYPEVENYSGNERSSISRYHVPLSRDAEKAGFVIYITNPQSFMDVITSERVKDWTRDFKPIKEFYDVSGRVISRIYLIPEEFVPNVPWPPSNEL